MKELKLKRGKTKTKKHNVLVLQGMEAEDYDTILLVGLSVIGLVTVCVHGWLVRPCEAL